MSEDGGATWTRVIVPESTSTGAIEVTINKTNPGRHRRQADPAGAGQRRHPPPSKPKWHAVRGDVWSQRVATSLAAAS
jgi:hypothetical protein